MRQDVVTETIGWVSSIILVLTISKQIYKQWQEESSEGVSKWLFIGQMLASLGFTIYSWLVQNWLFVVTNSLLLLSAFIGLGIVLYHRYGYSQLEKQMESGDASREKATRF